MKITSQSWPNIVVADADGVPVQGVSDSTAERYALEKVLELPAGEYKILRPDATVHTEDHVTETEEPVEEPTDPEPEPEPDDPVDPSTRPQETIQTLNPNATISFADHHDGGSAYVRLQRATILKTGDTLDAVVLKGRNGNTSFTGPEYTLYFSGIPVDTVQANGEKRLTFQPDLSVVDEGWHIASTTEDGEETCCKYPVFVYKDGTAQIDWMPTWTDSYVQQWSPEDNKIIWVPAQFNPIPKPLAPRSYKPFDWVPHRSTVWTEMLTGELSNYSRRPNITEEGVLTTANKQWYTWWDFIAKIPSFPLLDGLPGENSFGSATHIQVGNARQEDDPDSPFLGNIYVSDPWRICRLGPDGRLTTLIGWVHESLPSYYGDPHNLTLRGNWDAVPEERRGIWETWGFDWLASTLQVDHTADPIPEEDNRIPHSGDGPTMVVANTRHGSVLGVRFDPTAHGVEPVVWEIWHEDGAEPWDIKTRGDEIYVSDRTNHRIVQLDIQGNIVRTVVNGEALAFVDSNRFVKRSAGISTIRAQDCVLPEGLDLLDDWLYFGSAAMAQFKRVHLDDGRVEEAFTNNASGTQGANYYKIAVCDGTALPKGTMLLSSWSVSRYGGPVVIQPGVGSYYELFRADLTYRMPRGRASTIMLEMSYNTAVTAKNGRIIFGSVNSGLRQMSLAQPDDPEYDHKRYLEGKKLYNQRGGKYRWGEFGESFYGEPLPWGEHADLDYFLTVIGCTNEQV